MSSCGELTAYSATRQTSRAGATGTRTAGKCGETRVSTIEISGGVELPATRCDISLRTRDGLTLVGELSTPVSRPPVATLVTLHPLPTAGGFMDSHVLRKAAARLPALADLAVVRFNTRGTTSPRGRSEGEFGDGITEEYDLDAAMEFVRDHALSHVWLVGG